MPTGTTWNSTRDFAERTGFTFTVLSPGTEKVIGCLYIYPAKDGGGDAGVRSWPIA